MNKVLWCKKVGRYLFMLLKTVFKDFENGILIEKITSDKILLGGKNIERERQLKNEDVNQNKYQNKQNTNPVKRWVKKRRKRK